MHQIERPANLAKVIAASSAGTLIEWYDFYIFGSLAVTIADVFFPKGAGATALLSTLATFAIGFVVRPFGAVVFGHLGDKIGRKYTFMVTLVLMGAATFLIGVLPGYEARDGWPGIGWAAPVLLVLLRLLQGLALGGEYGGAATYVAEHAPDRSRGYWTSWIQTTATLGLFVSLAVILACRASMPASSFSSWGWRIPFWLSLGLVLFSYYIRRTMNESPLFMKVKNSGKASRHPFKEAFGNVANLKVVLLALFGAAAGQGVVWYTGQFYAMNFMKVTLGVEAAQAETMIGIALVAATPFFVIFGALSDRVGRKPIMMLGCVLAVLTYLPIYTGMQRAVDLKDETRFKLVSVEPSTDAASGVQKELRTYADGTTNLVTKSSTPTGLTEKRSVRFASLSAVPALTLMALVWIQVIYVTMVYGPIAAFLVELFPTRIRYSSMSLPYHIGNGVFGGMVPFIGQLLVERTGNPLAGLWYPMSVAAVTVVVGMLLVREKRNATMWTAEDEAESA